MNKHLYISGCAIKLEHKGSMCNVDRIVFYDNNDKKFYCSGYEIQNIGDVVVKNLVYVANNWVRQNEVKQEHKNFYFRQYDWKDDCELWIYVDNANVFRTLIRTSQCRSEEHPHEITIYNHYLVTVYDSQFEYTEYSHTFYDSIYRQAVELRKSIASKVNNFEATVNDLCYLLDTGMLNVRLQDVM